MLQKIYGDGKAIIFLKPFTDRYKDKMNCSQVLYPGPSSLGNLR
jgi:hypothetical protein